MASESKFPGFPKEALRFYQEIAKHNNRRWFEAHKQEYLNFVLKPAHDFVLALGPKLHTLAKYINYDAQTSGRGSIHRIYRDIRFSKDKTPYKTNLGIKFWLGEIRQGTVTPGFWIHVDKDGARIYAGMYRFSPEELRAFREAVAGEKMGADLQKIIAAIEKKRGFATGGDAFQRVPRGFNPGHKRADLLKYSSLYAISPLMKPAVVTSTKILDECYVYCKVMFPLTDWLMRMKAGTELKS